MINQLKHKLAYALLLISPIFAHAQGDLSQVQGVHYFSDPAISPNATEIAFVSGGDIWTVSANGGDARLLVSHPDHESRPMYSPDGKQLAFVSTRSGNGDIYLLTIATGELKRLTFDDAADELSGWSRDGKYIYFSSTGRDIAGMRDVYRVPVQGGTPMTVTDDRYVNEFFAMPSPDGKTLAFTARGVASHQWWRNGHSHLDESEIWLKHEANNNYQKITERGAKNLWPMWSDDGKSVYFISDRTGTENLYVQPIGGAAKQLTSFTKGRMLWPTIAHNGKAIVFEKDFNVWLFDVATGKAREVNIVRKGIPATAGVEHVRQSGQFRELALSPDGKKVAFVARGDVFVASAKDGGDAMRVTRTTAIEGELVWANNSNSIVYSSTRNGVSNLYQYNFITSTETQLTNDKLNDAAPKFSPNGQQLAYLRDGKQLRVLDVASKKDRLVTNLVLGNVFFSSSSAYTWSPDSKFLAYAGFGEKSFRNIYIVPAAGGESKPVTSLANTFTQGVSWSKDGKYILFNTRQRTENGFVARVDLVPHRPRFREEQFMSLFSETAPTAPATITAKAPATDTMFKKTAKVSGDSSRVVYEGIRQRLSMLPLGVDVDDHVISPDGKTLVLTATVAGQNNLYTYSLDEMAKEPAVLKQLTTTSSPKSSIQFSSDGKEVYYLEQGTIRAIGLETKTPRSIAVTAELDIDFAKERLEVFDQAWQMQNNGFYDPGFHGANWSAIRKTFAPLAAGAGTPDELRRILGLMVGELNASHLGVSGGSSSFNTGRIGLRFDRKEYENNGSLKITEVVSMSPSDLSGEVKVGQYLLAIDGTPITATTNVDELLQHKTNKMVALTIGNTAIDKQGKKVNVRPVSMGTEKGLLYKQWVQQQRDYVNKISNGRLGYVHMFDMSQESLNQFYLDIDAENHAREGVVVDVRNNNGGFVNAYALDVLSRRGYMNMTIRGLPTAPARTMLGQRALDAPTILVTNQHSLSDAEDFSEGYRALKLGKIVGEPTGGWIIYTSNVTLFDGTTVRLPFIKITDQQGKNMELAPRPVDIPVSNPIGETGKDTQLDVAVRELLKQLEAGKKK